MVPFPPTNHHHNLKISYLFCLKSTPTLLLPPFPPTSEIVVHPPPPILPPMKTGINPKVDCVFKAIFGAEDNKDVLIHLLNAVLDPDPEHRIASVELLNPYNDRTFEDGRKSLSFPFGTAMEKLKYIRMGGFVILPIHIQMAAAISGYYFGAGAAK